MIQDFNLEHYLGTGWHFGYGKNNEDYIDSVADLWNIVCDPISIK